VTHATRRRYESAEGFLKNSKRLREGLEKMIEQERAAMHGDPEQVAKAWLERLSKVDDERRGYLRLAASDSGGPMWATPQGRRQIGIASFGAGCGDKGHPGVYAEVNAPSIRTFITNAANR
jgi:hypothetical protein